MRLRTGRLAALAMACTTGLALTACSTGSGGTTSTSSDTGEAVKGGTLNMLGSGDVDYMDPNISYYSVGYQVLRMWTRQLFTYPAEADKVTTAVPDLAESLPTQDNGVSEDGMTYTITLRQGAMWSTDPARQITAADVVRGVKRTCNPVQPFGGLPDYEDLLEGMTKFCGGFAKAGSTPAKLAAYMEDTELPGVVAKDDLTVEFHLTHPASFFTDMLTLPAFSPAPEEFDSYLPASAELAQNTISSGPYKIDSYTPTKNITLSRNPAWDESTDPVRKAYVEKIVIDETVSQDSTQQQLETGTPNADMEFDNAPPPSQLPALISSKDPNFNLGETASSNPYIVYNTASPADGGALGKVGVRQALSYAINRDNIIQVLGGPTVNPPLTHVLPESIVGGENDFDPYPYDAEKAKQLLSDAGYPNGITVKVLYRNESEGSSKTFQTLQQDLSKAGIKVVGVPSPNADFYTKYLQVPSVAERGVWSLAVAGWGPDWYGDAALSYFNPLYSGEPSFPPVGSNFGLYDSEKTNGLITQASQAKTQEEAADLWSQADHQVMDDAAFFPITSPQNTNYHASHVHNAVFIPAFQNFDATNVWLSADKQG